MKNKLKKVISTCIAVIMLLSTAAVAPISASAAETEVVSTGETSGDFEYETLDDGTAQITYYTGSASELAIPSELDGKKITSIGSGAFYSCTSLTSVTIPDSVASIGMDAFSGCTSLTSVIIPDSVTSIGAGAFYGCTSLKSVTIPDSVTSIGGYAFYGTAWYDNQPDGVVYVGKVLHKYKGTMPQNTTITIKDGTKSISDKAFLDCTSLTSITIPDSVTSIGMDAFYGCTSLTDVTIPDSVTNIDFGVFENCTSLTSVIIPDSVTSIYDAAFSGCTSLTDVTIPDSVTSIGFGVFSDTAWYNNQPDGVVYAGKVLYEYKGTMPQNTTITIKDGTKSISDQAFSFCTSLKSVTIPDSVISIGMLAFYDCTSLTSITIPDSVTYIGWGAFEDCTSLTSITIPDSVIIINGKTFSGCTSLTSVIIPDSVIFIDVEAFENCTSLTSVTIPANVDFIDGYAFGFYEDDDYNYVKIDGFTITGYSDTAAEQYANNNGFEFISLGEAPTTEPTTAEPTTEPTEVPTTEPTEPATVVTDKDTNVSVEGEIPEGVELKVQSEEIADENAVAVYNITLEKDGEAVQPDGKVTVKLPVPDGVDGSQCKVYYIDGDSKTDMNAVFVDGFMVFETDHFSVYAVVKTEKASVLLGDVNADGKVNIKDATTIQKSAASIVTLTDEQAKPADVNGDGKVNVNDATAIQKFVAGIDTGFKIGE